MLLGQIILGGHILQPKIIEQLQYRPYIMPFVVRLTSMIYKPLVVVHILLNSQFTLTTLLIQIIKYDTKIIFSSFYIFLIRYLNSSDNSRSVHTSVLTEMRGKRRGKFG